MHLAAGFLVWLTQSRDRIFSVQVERERKQDQMQTISNRYQLVSPVLTLVTILSNMQRFRKTFQTLLEELVHYKHNKAMYRQFFE